MLQEAGALHAEGFPSFPHTRAFQKHRVREVSGAPPYTTATV
jgi:hypothetical protein